MLKLVIGGIIGMKRLYQAGLILIFAGFLSACSGTPAMEEKQDADKITVVVTTTFIRNVAENIAGDNVSITALLEPGQNPHSYQPSPKDMVAITEADLILANGFGLEEFLDDLLAGSDTSAEVIVVSEGIDPLMAEAHDHDDPDEVHDDEYEGEDHDDDHLEGTMGLDPHVWFDPNNILIWVKNISLALTAVDPSNAERYQEQAAKYSAELVDLDDWIGEQINVIPEENRELVTDHTSLGYLARQYGLEQIGAVIPALTTEAETSGMELAELIDTIREHQTKAIFVGVDFDPNLAQRVADETGVDLVPIYFGSLSDGEPAGTYLSFMRFNMSAIVKALQ